MVTLVVVALAGGAPARGATPPVTIENIRVGFRQEVDAQSFKVGTWTPVRVDLKGGPARFRGVLDVIVPDDDGTPTVVRRAVDVAPGALTTVTAYVRPGSTNAEFRVQCPGRGRPPAGRRRQRLGPLARPGPGAVLTLGRPGGVERVATLPEFKAENSAARRSRSSSPR
jgi:hypothetical protein